MANISEPIEGKFLDRRYFNSIRGYTLSILNAFDGVSYWVESEDPETQKAYTIPLSFANYEKAQVLGDLDEDQLKSGNFGYLPRLVLSFEGLTKATDRQTGKFQKLTKKVYPPDGKPYMDISYNSVAYDFNFTLLLQSRGLTIASQVTEEILSKFNPTLNLMINEFPIFETKTETQIQISDPAFEIMDEFQDEDINIIQVTFDITVRGNIYSPIQLQGAVETVKLFSHIWDKSNYEDSKLASYYRFDVSQTGTPETDGIVYRETKRIFTGDSKSDPDVEHLDEQTVIDKRPDYHKYQESTEFPEQSPVPPTEFDNPPQPAEGNPHVGREDWRTR